MALNYVCSVRPRYLYSLTFYKKYHVVMVPLESQKVIQMKQCNCNKEEKEKLKYVKRVGEQNIVQLSLPTGFTGWGSGPIFPGKIDAVAHELRFNV